ncbi:MAG TPA: tryptophanase [candidate division Zixibacteria bacterium]|nr:tryptophanase [candidate division Zixibacteria bacterium]
MAVEEPSVGFRFSTPYEIAAVRPLRQTTPAERAAALAAARYNTELLPQELIYVDLSTDSGVSALNTAQLAALAAAPVAEPGMGLAPEASRAYRDLASEFQRIFGFPYVVPVTQGRAAERIWIRLHVKPGSVVAGNMLFPSTRTHIEMSGGKVADVIVDAAHDLGSEEPFKGNLDIDKLRALFSEGRDKVSCIYVEVAVNACGGHPVSVENLRAVRAVATANGVPLFLDACRLLENSYLVKQREPGYSHRPVREIVAEICGLADGLTMSALKDLAAPAGGFIATRDPASYQKAWMQAFLDGAQLGSSAMEVVAAGLRELFATDAYVAGRVEQVQYLWRRLGGGVPLVRPPSGHAVYIDVRSFLPHVAPENHPAEALAAFIYGVSGVRLCKGPPPAPSQSARGTELLRLAVPARKYLRGHLDDVAEAVFYAYSRRAEIKGLKRVEEPGRSKHQPAYFTPL